VQNPFLFFMTPALIAALSGRWQLRIGEPFTGGSVAYVAPVERADGSAAVLKISPIDDETRHEADALALWDGDGVVRLLERDDTLGAMLLERLHPGDPLSALPESESIPVACGLLRRLRRPLPAGHPFTAVTTLVAGWSLTMPLAYERAGRPFAIHLLNRAVRLCEEFAEARIPAVLVNRDFHLSNVLSAEREPWLMIDPKPLAGEPAFDTGYLLESFLDPHPDRQRAAGLIRSLSACLDLDPGRIADWAFVRAVENALWAVEARPDSIGVYVATAEVLLPR
jgi:streptomycin 6-kinase